MIPGDPEDEMLVVLASSLALARSIVPIPVIVFVERPTWIVLITPVVAMPTEVGMKSTLREDPLKYAWYVPSPVAETPPRFVVNLPYSIISIFEPSWTMLSSTASNSSFLVKSGFISTKTLTLVWVSPIETIVVVTPDVTGELFVSIVATPPKLVVPTPRKLSFKLYERTLRS